MCMVVAGEIGEMFTKWGQPKQNNSSHKQIKTHIRSYVKYQQTPPLDSSNEEAGVGKTDCVQC